MVCECGYPDGYAKEDGVIYCPLCGLIPEPSPDWSLTHEDMASIYNPADPQNDIPAHNDPKMNDKGYQKYAEHVNQLYQKLGMR